MSIKTSRISTAHQDSEKAYSQQIITEFVSTSPVPQGSHLGPFFINQQSSDLSEKNAKY